DVPRLQLQCPPQGHLGFHNLAPDSQQGSKVEVRVRMVLFYPNGPAELLLRFDVLTNSAKSRAQIVACQRVARIEPYGILVAVNGVCIGAASHEIVALGQEGSGIVGSRPICRFGPRLFSQPRGGFAGGETQYERLRQLVYDRALDSLLEQPPL